MSFGVGRADAGDDFNYSRNKGAHIKWRGEECGAREGNQKECLDVAAQHEFLHRGFF